LPAEGRSCYFLFIEKSAILGLSFSLQKQTTTPKGTDMDLTETFCIIDDFCKEFEALCNHHLLAAGKQPPKRKSRLSTSEVITILIWQCFRQISRNGTSKRFVWKIVWRQGVYFSRFIREIVSERHTAGYEDQKEYEKQTHVCL
jgi:hypothetical protein